MALVHRFDGALPGRYFKDVMDHIEMNPEHFVELCDKACSPQLWERKEGKWVLVHKVS